MTGLSDDVEMLVLNQNNRPIRSDHARAGTTAEFFSQELNSGKYVVAFRLADQTSRSSFVVTVRRTPVAISTSPSSPRPSTQLPPNGFSSDPSIIAAAKQYYETRGEWAGIYTIEARRMKVTRRGSNEIRVDLAYRFTCATSSSRCSGGRTGNDQRYFILRLINGRWVGQGMGGYQSARF